MSPCGTEPAEADGDAASQPHRHHSFWAMRFDPTSEKWRYDLRLFLLAYIFGVIAFSAVIPG